MDENKKIILARRARFLAAAASMIATTSIERAARADDAAVDASADASSDANDASDASDADRGVFVEGGVRRSDGYGGDADPDFGSPSACLCAASPENGPVDFAPGAAGLAGALAIASAARRRKRSR